MLLAYAYYRLTGGDRRSRVDRAALFRRDRTVRAGLLRRADLARRDGAGCDRRVSSRASPSGPTRSSCPPSSSQVCCPATSSRTGLSTSNLLRPQSLLGLELSPLAHGVFWSLLVNAVAFVVVSLARPPEPIERLQANIFVPQELVQAPGLPFVADNGHDRRPDRDGGALCRRRTSRARPIAALRASGRPCSIHIARPTFTCFASPSSFSTSAIGASSSRIVLSLLMKRRDPSAKSAFKLLDDATAAIQYNRDLLQTALDQVAQGIAVFDRDLRLICWNRRFRLLLGLAGRIRAGRRATRRDHPAQCRQRRIRTGRGQRHRRGTDRAHGRSARNLPRSPPLDRHGDRGSFEPDAGWRHRDDLHRHQRAGQDRGDARAPRARADRGTHPRQRGPGQGEVRGG